MVSASLISLLLATAVNAVPFLTERDFNLTRRNPNRKLANGEMLLFGQNHSEVIQAETWNKIVESKGYLSHPPLWNQSWIDDAKHMAPVPYNETIHGHGPEKRDCAHTFSIVTDKKERFVNWDVQMSPVVIGYGKGIDVTVSKSYSVANAVTVSAGLDLKIIKDRLGGSLGVSLSRTWTTQQGYLIRGTIEEGETGVVVSTPWTTRYYGRAFQGCVGSMKQTGTWIADTYEEGSYEGVDWVAGAITVCAKKQKSIPLTRCNGSGDFK
ncbi:hypothetical protein ColLi_08368 [Colletotrichum liriopes]|uniref:Celp0028 effector like protein n=1 Tax=Colletotrichum liriopes TaxID=708192 RepID=A0AA37GRL1_9PEZI|nr:hypothetical protein ColLi_08368 [Colletotrichum liriopes]